MIMQYASENIKPVTLELGGKSPNIFFDDVWSQNDDFRDKALEGFTMFALNQGEVCTCPSRALVQRGNYGEFMEAAVARTELIKPGHPLDTDTMIGAQASNDQLEKILSYLDIGRQEGATIRTGGERVEYDGELKGGYYVQPTIFEGDNRMRIFQEEIFGPVVSVTSFDDFDDAIKIANDTLYGLEVRRVDARHQHRLSRGPRDPGGPGVDELLPRLPRARGVRRLQAVRHRPGDAQDDAGALPADEEPPGVVLAEEAGLLLDAREKAPDLGFHPSGAFHSARSRPRPACVLTPISSRCCTLPTSASGPVTDQTLGSAFGCVTLADALPLVHGLLDEAVRLPSKAVEGLGVVAEENLDALVGAADASGRVHSGVEPERDPGMPETVRPLGQARSTLSTSQGVLPGPRPRDAVGGSVHVVASLVPEKSTVRCHAKPIHMGTQHPYELRRDGNRPRRAYRATLERVHLVHLTVVGPLLARRDNPAREVQHPPSSLWQVALIDPQVDDLSWPHSREDGLQWDVRRFRRNAARDRPGR